jgi:hypothetical protein
VRVEQQVNLVSRDRLRTACASISISNAVGRTGVAIRF